MECLTEFYSDDPNNMINIYVTHREAICQMPVLKSQKIRAVRNAFCRKTGQSAEGDLFLHDTKLLEDLTVDAAGIQEEDILKFQAVPRPRHIAVSVTTMRAKGREILRFKITDPAMTVGMLKAATVRDHLALECPSTNQLLLTYHNTELYDNQTIQSLNISQNDEIRAKIIPYVDSPNLSRDIMATTINGQSLTTIEEYPTRDLVINFTIADDTPEIARNQIILTIYTLYEAGQPEKQIEIERIDSTTHHKQFTISYTTHEELAPDTVYWMRLQSFHERYAQDEEHSVVTISFRTKTLPFEKLNFSWPTFNLLWTYPVMSKMQGLGDLFRVVREYLMKYEPHVVHVFDETIVGFMMTRQDDALTGGMRVEILLQWDDQVCAVLPQYDTIVLLEVSSYAESLKQLCSSAAAAAVEEHPIYTKGVVKEDSPAFNNVVLDFLRRHQEKLEQREQKVQQPKKEKVDMQQILQKVEAENLEYHRQVLQESVQQILHAMTANEEEAAAIANGKVDDKVDDKLEGNIATAMEQLAEIDDGADNEDVAVVIEALALQTMVDKFCPANEPPVALDTTKEKEEYPVVDEILEIEAEGCEAATNAAPVDDEHPAASEDNEEDEDLDFLEDDGEFVFVDVPPSDLQSILLTDNAAHADFVD